MPASEVVENAVRESESRFRALANSAPVLIWSSGPDGLCTYFNQRWLRFTGRTLEESLGEGWVHDVHPDDRNRVLDEYKQAFQAREEFRLEYRLRQHGKGYKWIVDFGSRCFARTKAFWDTSDPASQWGMAKHARRIGERNMMRSVGTTA